MGDSEVPIDHEESSLRSRSRDRDDHDDDQRDNRSRSRSRSEDRGQDGENFSLYITHLSYETKDDALRAAFEKFGKVEKAAVIREPVTHVSRGFAFVTMSTVEESNAAIEGLNNTMLDGKEIKVERARRTQGYQKTPGQYLGPPGLSSRFIKERREREANRRRGNSRDRRDNRGRSRDNRGRDRSRERTSRDRPVNSGRRSRSRSRERSRDRNRDDRDRLPRELVGDPRLDLMRDDRYYRTLDPRDRLLLDPRAIELYHRDLALGLRGFPPPILDARPLFDMRGRSPVRGLPGDYPPPRGRSPPRDHRDDRRGPPPHSSPAGSPPFDGRGPPPPVAGYAASAYYSNRLPPSRF